MGDNIKGYITGVIQRSGYMELRINFVGGNLDAPRDSIVYIEGVRDVQVGAPVALAIAKEK